jgi:hypothetical protein
MKSWLRDMIVNQSSLKALIRDGSARVINLTIGKWDEVWMIQPRVRVVVNTSRRHSICLETWIAKEVRKLEQRIPHSLLFTRTQSRMITIEER